MSQVCFTSGRSSQRGNDRPVSIDMRQHTGLDARTRQSIRPVNVLRGQIDGDVPARRHPLLVDDAAIRQEIRVEKPTD